MAKDLQGLLNDVYDEENNALRVSTSGAYGMVGPPWVAGRYHAAYGTRTTWAHGTGIATAVPLWTPQGGGSIDRLGCEVTTAAATAVGRLGIYEDDGTGRPGVLLLDAGTVDASTTGAKEIAIATLALPDPLYWAVLVSQVASATFRAMRHNGLMPVDQDSLGNLMGGETQNGFTKSGVTGALPTPFAATSQTSAGYLVGWRAA